MHRQCSRFLGQQKYCITMVCVCVRACVPLSRVRLFAIPQTLAHQVHLSMEFSRQEYWSRLTFPSPGDIPDPGIEPGSPVFQGLPRQQSGKESACQCRRLGFNPWVRKIPWRRKQQTTTAFLPGKSYGQRCLAGHSPWGCRRVGRELATKQKLLHCRLIFYSLSHQASPISKQNTFHF